MVCFAVSAIMVNVLLIHLVSHVAKRSILTADDPSKQARSNGYNRFNSANPGQTEIPPLALSCPAVTRSACARSSAKAGAEGKLARRPLWAPGSAGEPVSGRLRAGC
jgi:hypothetical protein